MQIIYKKVPEDPDRRDHGWRPLVALKRDHINPVFCELVALPILIVSPEMTLIVLQLTNSYLIQAAWKPAVCIPRAAVATAFRMFVKSPSCSYMHQTIAFILYIML